MKSPSGLSISHGHAGCEDSCFVQQVATMENELEPIRFLTVREAAEMLQVSKRTLERMIYDKKFPAFKVGRQWRVCESQLNKWIKTLDEL